MILYLEHKPRWWPFCVVWWYTVGEESAGDGSADDDTSFNNFPNDECHPILMFYLLSREPDTLLMFHRWQSIWLRTALWCPNDNVLVHACGFNHFITSKKRMPLVRRGWVMLPGVKWVVWLGEWKQNGRLCLGKIETKLSIIIRIRKKYWQTIRDKQ